VIESNVHENKKKKKRSGRRSRGKGDPEGAEASGEITSHLPMTGQGATLAAEKARKGDSRNKDALGNPGFATSVIRFLDNRRTPLRLGIERRTLRGG